MIIDIFLPLSLVFIMFTLGIGLTVQNFQNIINQPKALILGLINQMVLLPLSCLLYPLYHLLCYSQNSLPPQPLFLYHLD